MSDWEDVAIGPPSDDGDWEDVSPEVVASPGTVEVQPSWSDAAKYVGQSFLEGGLNTTQALADAMNPASYVARKMMGEGAPIESIKELTGLGVPDEDIQGTAPRYARAVMNSVAIPVSPVANALAAISGEGARDLGAGTGGQVVASMLGGGIPGLALKGGGALLNRAGRATERASLGIQAGDYSKSLKQGGLSLDDAGDLTTRLQRSADDVIKEGILPKFRTAEGTVSRLEAAREVAGKGIGDILSAADEVGATPKLRFSKTNDLIKKAPATTRGELSSALDDFKAKITDEKNGWDGTLSELAKIRSNLGADAFVSKLSGQGNRALSSKLSKAVYSDLTDALETSVKGSLGDDALTNLKGLNKQYGNYKTILDPTTKALTREAASTLDKRIRTGIRTSGGIGTVLGTSAMAGNLPLGVALSGLILASGTTPGRAISGSLAKNIGTLSQHLGGAAGVPLSTIVSKGLDEGSKEDKEANNSKDSEGTHFSLIPEAGAQELSPSDLNITTSEEDMKPRSNVLSALFETESSNNPKAVGPKTKYGTAKGLGQLLDSTGKEWARKLGYKTYDPFDEKQNRAISEAYLSHLLDQSKGSEVEALARYNFGMGNIDKLKKKYGDRWVNYLPDETSKYVLKILAKAPVSSAMG